MLERVLLGQDAIAYVRWSLSYGQRSLGASLQTLPLESGQAFTFAPAGTDRARLSRFRESMGEGVASYSSVVSFVTAYLGKQPAPRYFVLEDVLVEAGDPWLDAASAYYITFGQEIYHFVSNDRASEDVVLQAMDYAKGYVTNAILTGGVSVPHLESREEVTEQQLRALADATDYILVEAYDGEGFVIWCRE